MSIEMGVSMDKVGVIEKHCIPDIEHHQELIVKEVRKKGRCLKCGIVFVSCGYGNRCCGACAQQNQKYAWRAEKTMKVE